MRFLNREGDHVWAPRPDLVLMDLNLPKMDRPEVLAHIKTDPSLKMIQVIVLTTSASEMYAQAMTSGRLESSCLSGPKPREYFEQGPPCFFPSHGLSRAKPPVYVRGRALAA
jgi:CheY-like chemotaxis protein